MNMEGLEFREFLEIVKIYNQISDLLWVGDIEGIKTLLNEKLFEIKIQYLEEEEKWRNILKEIKKELTTLPREERDKKRSQLLAEKCKSVEINKVIAGILLKEFQKIKDLFSQPSLDIFFEKNVTVPVKKKKYTYLLLQITDKNFEARALIEKLPDENTFRKAINRIAEKWKYQASEPQIIKNGLFFELFSAEGYIKVHGFHKKVRMQFSLQRTVNTDYIRNLVEFILENITQ